MSSIRNLAKARCATCSRRIPTYIDGRTGSALRYEPHWTTSPWELFQRFTYGRTLCSGSDTEIDERTAELSMRKIY